MPFNRFPDVDTVLGPEMRSTGEVMGIDRTFGLAFGKAQIAAGERLYTRYGFRRLLELRAIHIAQPDIGNTGGIAETGRKLGIVDDARWQVFELKREAIAREQERLRDTWVSPRNLPEEDAIRVLGKPVEREYNLHELLRRPDVSYASLLTLPCAGVGVDDAKVAEQVETQAKYHGYIERQHDEIERNAQYETWALPDDMDYHEVRGLSIEVQQKLNRHMPESIGQAARISGVTPAAISLLLVHLKRGLRGN